jgi:hypothetical protein
MELQKTLKFLDVSFSSVETSKLQLFEMVHAIGIELTKNNQRGLLLDFLSGVSAMEVVEIIKSGLRTSFPFLPNLYLAYVTDGVDVGNKQVDAGIISARFTTKTEAINWLNNRLN